MTPAGITACPLCGWTRPRFSRPGPRTPHPSTCGYAPQRVGKLHDIEIFIDVTQSPARMSPAREVEAFRGAVLQRRRRNGSPLDGPIRMGFHPDDVVTLQAHAAFAREPVLDASPLDAWHVSYAQLSAPASRTVTTCPDCKGSKVYVGLGFWNGGAAEPCRACAGSGQRCS